MRAPIFRKTSSWLFNSSVEKRNKKSIQRNIYIYNHARSRICQNYVKNLFSRSPLYLCLPLSHPRTGNKQFFQVNLFLLFDCFFFFSQMFLKYERFYFSQRFIYHLFFSKLRYSMWPYSQKSMECFFRRNIFRPDFRHELHFLHYSI